MLLEGWRIRLIWASAAPKNSKQSINNLFLLTFEAKLLNDGKLRIDSAFLCRIYLHFMKGYALTTSWVIGLRL